MYIYFPDFYIEKLNLIIEIKSEYYYYLNLEKNIAKEKACLEQGYKYILIIDKNYKEFENTIKNPS
jgi:very-short-patch-repair endonuclease